MTKNISSLQEWPHESPKWLVVNWDHSVSDNKIYEVCNLQRALLVVEQNLVGISAVALDVFYRHSGIYAWRGPWGIVWKMTSSTKPEVLSVSQRRQRRTEPRPHATCTKLCEVRPCGFWDMRADRQTDRQTKQTDILITILCTPPGGEVTMA